MDYKLILCLIFFAGTVGFCFLSIYIHKQYEKQKAENRKLKDYILDFEAPWRSTNFKPIIETHKYDLVNLEKEHRLPREYVTEEVLEQDGFWEHIQETIVNDMMKMVYPYVKFEEYYDPITQTYITRAYLKVGKKV